MKVAGAGMPNQRCALGVAACCISASPPQHDMVTTDNDVSSGRYGVNLNQDSNTWRHVTCQVVGSFGYLTGTR